MSLGDLLVGTPYVLEDGTTVYLDDEGRVMVPPPPSAWDIFWRAPATEIGSATRQVLRGTGQLVGETVGATAGGVAGAATPGVLEGVLAGAGPLLLLAAGALVAVMVLKR